MSDDTPVLVERRDHVAIVTINRPEARNAVNQAVWIGVGAALAEADRDPAIRAVIVTGTGEQSFSAGADLKAIARGEPVAPADPVQAAWGFAGIASHVVSVPLIAAVNGTALGGGTEIALACDLVVAAEEASFGLPEVKRGLIAGAGGAFRLAQQLPRKLAMEILLTGDPIDARRALELGLVNQVVPRAQLMEAALALAGRVAANAPLSVQASKRLALGIDLGSTTMAVDGDGWRRTSGEVKIVMRSEDAREGPRAFAEKRAPNWQGR